MAIKLRCTACRDTFPWDAAKKWPDYCPLCGTDISSPERDSIVMPFVRSSTKTKAVDDMYRQMEDGSEFRATAAAQELGVPVAEMSDLKITNMKDNLRTGDTTAVEVTAANNAIVKHMEATKQGGFQNNGAAYGAGTASGAVNVNGQIVTGIEPRAGARALTNLQRQIGKA